MDRETFRLLLYGHYAFTNLQDSIEKEPMQKYVDGGMFAYDFMNKQKIEIKVARKPMLDDEDSILLALKEQPNV